MSIVESDRLPSWSLDASKTGESIKIILVGRGGGTGVKEQKKIGRL